MPGHFQGHSKGRILSNYCLSFGRFLKRGTSDAFHSCGTCVLRTSCTKSVTQSTNTSSKCKSTPTHPHPPHHPLTHPPTHNTHTHTLSTDYHTVQVTHHAHTEHCIKSPPHTVLTRITYLIPQTCRTGFPQVAARQSADRQHGNARIVRAAMCGSSTDLYNHPRMNAEAYVLD